MGSFGVTCKHPVAIAFLGVVTGEAGLVPRLVDRLTADEPPEPPAACSGKAFAVFHHDVHRGRRPGNRRGGKFGRGSALPRQFHEGRSVRKGPDAAPESIDCDRIAEHDAKLVERRIFERGRDQRLAAIPLGYGDAIHRRYCGRCRRGGRKRCRRDRGGCKGAAPPRSAIPMRFIALPSGPHRRSLAQNPAALPAADYARCRPRSSDARNAL